MEGRARDGLLARLGASLVLTASRPSPRGRGARGYFRSDSIFLTSVRPLDSTCLFVTRPIRQSAHESAEMNLTEGTS